ncbi:MAG: hypothetical protein ACRD23_04290 [Terriglobales bacterium]
MSTAPPISLASPMANSAGEPSQREVLLIAGLVCLTFVATVSRLTNYPGLVANFGDSPGYIYIGAAIQHWDFHGLMVKHFWGLPYAMAAVSRLTGVSELTSLLLVSATSFFASTALAYRLWGGWVAGLFAVLNFDWMQRSFLGGSEPLFVALLFGAFLAVRHERWSLAALLAALSTTVRPLAFFALLGIGLILLRRREYQKAALATLVGLVIGILYALPLWKYFGDPLATVHSYQDATSRGPALFGFPFYAIIKGTLLYPAPWTSLVLSFGWMVFVLLGVAAMLTRPAREYVRRCPVEVFFAAFYTLAIFSYNAPYWARGTFPRFAIPIIPLAIAALLPWVPKSRALLWILAVTAPVLAAASAIGLKNVVQMIRV